MSFNFVFDRFVDGHPYPNLAPLIDLSQGSGQLELEYPRIIPLRLLYFLNDHAYPYATFHIDQDFPNHSFYPVGIAWFNFELDYFGLMSNRVLTLCRDKKLKILFYYHEGDNPQREKDRLDQLCDHHRLPHDCYVFISGNTQADLVPGFVFFADHELFYWRCSRQQPVIPAHAHPRSHRFTVLSRRHQSWRATVMAWLHQQKILDQSFWSYNVIGINDGYYRDNPMKDNPIRMMPYYPGLPEYVNAFLAKAPYTCDTLTDDQHNTHDLLVEQHFQDSYCNIVLETLFDAEQSGGAFLTEKTFKPIRHAQPFVIFGCANSIRTLNDLGYRTFDHAIDNCYDKCQDNRERFANLTKTITHVHQSDLHELYQKCMPDIEHNQQLFLSSKYSRLSNLYDKLLYQLATT
jgi:hypothetical protein